MGFFSSLNKERKRFHSKLNKEWVNFQKSIGLKGLFDNITGKTAERLQAEQIRQQEKARKDSLSARVQAKKAEQFGGSEGLGQGALGEIRSGLSDELDEEEDIRQGKGNSTTLRI